MRQRTHRREYGHAFLPAWPTNSDAAEVELMTKLADILKRAEDQALFFPPGAAGRIRELHVYHVGLPYEPSERAATVI